MDDIERNRKIYQLTDLYIRAQMLEANGFDPRILDKYIYWHGERLATLPALYERLLIHAKNTRASGQGDIEKVFGSGFSPVDSPAYKRWATLKALLYDFDPEQVATKYPTVDVLEDALREAYKTLTLKHFSTRYCRTIVDGAAFLAQFKNAADFYDRIDKLYAINPADAADLIDTVAGFGHALSRDFLKEMGYLDFVKPDEHVLDICEQLHLIEKRDGGLAEQVLRRIATDCAKTPYTVDKLFFLLGSGDFYMPTDSPIREKLAASNNQKTKRKQAFADYVLTELAK